MKTPPTITVLGSGHLGSLIVAGWLKTKIFSRSQIKIVVKSEKSAKKLRKSFPGLSVLSLEKKIPIPIARLYLIAVRPGQWPELLTQLKKELPRAQSSQFISIMAGIGSEKLESQLGKPTVTAMTNTALQVNSAVTTLFFWNPIQILCGGQKEDYADVSVLWPSLRITG